MSWPASREIVRSCRRSSVALDDLEAQQFDAHTAPLVIRMIAGRPGGGPRLVVLAGVPASYDEIPLLADDGAQKLELQETLGSVHHLLPGCETALYLSIGAFGEGQCGDVDEVPAPRFGSYGKASLRRTCRSRYALSNMAVVLRAEIDVIKSGGQQAALSQDIDDLPVQMGHRGEVGMADHDMLRQ